MYIGGLKPPSPKGKPKSKEWRLKMSIAQKRSWASGRIQRTQSAEERLHRSLNNPKKLGTKESPEACANKKLAAAKRVAEGRQGRKPKEMISGPTSV